MLVRSIDACLSHFKLTAAPFSLTPDPQFLYLSPGHAEALAALTLGVTGRNGIVLLTGEVGTGKTTLMYSLLRTIGDGMRTAYVSHSGVGFDGLLRLALEDFGVTSASSARFDMLAALNAMLRDCAEHGRTAVLAVDEAHNLADDDFEQLRLLSNFETFTHKLLQIVLVGQPELVARLRARPLRALTERVAVHCQLEPLGAFESRAYLDYRLLCAGGSTHLFEPAARDLLLRGAQGIPRRINILCHNALLFAYGRGEARVTLSCARAAVEARAALMELPDLSATAGPETAAAPRRRLAIAGAAAAVAVAALVGGWLSTDGWRAPPVSPPAPLAAPAAVPAAPPPVVVALPESGVAQPASAVPPADVAETTTPVVAAAGSGQLVVDEAPPVVDGAAVVAAPLAPEPTGPAAPDASEEDAAPSGERLVRVEPGQTLAALVRAAYGDVTADLIRRVQQANPKIVDRDHILAGDMLRFPDDLPETRRSAKDTFHE